MYSTLFQLLQFLRYLSKDLRSRNPNAEKNSLQYISTNVFGFIFGGLTKLPLRSLKIIKIVEVFTRVVMGTEIYLRSLLILIEMFQLSCKYPIKRERCLRINIFSTEATCKETQNLLFIRWLLYLNRYIPIYECKMNIKIYNVHNINLQIDKSLEISKISHSKSIYSTNFKIIL